VATVTVGTQRLFEGSDLETAIENFRAALKKGEKHKPDKDSGEDMMTKKNRGKSKSKELIFTLDA